MNKTGIILLVLVSLVSSLIPKSQNSVTLKGILENMQQWNELYKVSAATDSVFNLKKSNISSNYLPKIDLNAEAAWQSDVTSVKVPLPGVSIPSPDRDNYKVTVDVSQLIWDGGATNSLLRIEDETRKIELNRIESELYSQKERVASIYFGILSVDLANRQLKLMAAELDKRIAELEAGVNAGVVLESSVNSIRAERLRLEQSIDANLSQRISLVSAIYSLTGVRIDENTDVLLPELPIPDQVGCERPDYKLFELQHSYLSVASEALTSKRLPRLSTFARVGYGKPGLNMLSNEFDAFALLGSRLSWNIWDWNSTSRERQSLKIQQNILRYRRAAYNEGFDAQVASSLAQIQSLQRQIQGDERIVELLERSVKVSASQLKNGSITSSAYLSDFNGLLRAKIDWELHKVKLSHEVVKLYLTMGISINQ